MASFEIAQGHVDIQTRVDRPQIIRSARMAGNLFAKNIGDANIDVERDKFWGRMFRPSRALLSTLRTGIPGVLASPIGAAGLALGVIFAGQFVSAVLTSGIIGAISGAFIGLAAVALKDMFIIRREWTATGKHIAAELADAARPMLPALVEASEAARSIFTTRIKGPLEAIFEGLAPTVIPLIDGIGRTIENMLNQIGTPEALAGFREIMRSISDELPRLGTSIGRIFSDIADNSDEVAEGFGNAMTVMGGLLGFINETLLFLTRGFNSTMQFFRDLKADIEAIVDPFVIGLEKINSAIEDQIGDVGSLEGAWNKFIEIGTKDVTEWGDAILGTGEKTDEAGKAAHRSTGKFEAVALAMREKAAEAADALQAKLERLARVTEDLNEQEQNLRDSLFATGEQALLLHEQQDALTESVQNAIEVGKDAESTDLARRDALRQVAERSQALITTMVEQGAGTEDVRKKTQFARDEFLRVADALGIDAKKANQLADEYGLIPEEVETLIKMIGDANARARIAALRTDLALLNGSVASMTIQQRVQRTVAIQTIGNQGQNFGQQRAAGGPTGGHVGTAQGGGPRSADVLVHQDEVLRLPFGTNVIPSREQARGPIPSGAGFGSSGVQEIRVILELEGADEAMIEALRGALRTRGAVLGVPA